MIEGFKAKCHDLSRIRRWSEGGKQDLHFDYIRNNAEHNKQWQDLQLLQDKNLGYSYGNNPLDDSGLGGLMPNAMDESVQTRQPQMPPHPYQFGMHTRFGDDSDDTIQRPALQNIKQFNSQTSFFNNGSFQQNQRCHQQQVNYIQGNQQQHQQQQHTFNHPNITQQGIHRRQFQFGNLRPLCYNFYENQQSTTEIGDIQSIDAARAWNNEYSLEAFFAEITDQERTHHSNPLLNQVEISAADRQTLVSWLINVCRSPAQLQVQSMHQEALHLCIAIIDDYTSKVQIRKDRFQLIGVTALLLASKQLIYDAPEISTLLSLCENIYSLKDVKRCEQEILKTLKFRLHRPTAHTFLDFFAGRLLHQFNWVHEPSKRITNHLAVARYCMTFGLLSIELAKYYPSTRARAAYILASELLEEPRLDLPFGEKEYKNENEAVKILKQILLDESEHRLKIHPNIFHRFSYT